MLVAACDQEGNWWRRIEAAVTSGKPEWVIEHVRWKAEDDNPEARAAAKDVRLAKRFAELDVRREAQAERWETKPDMLS